VISTVDHPLKTPSLLFSRRVARPVPTCCTRNRIFIKSFLCNISRSGHCTQRLNVTIPLETSKP
jgi:hypothetical protein